MWLVYWPVGSFCGSVRLVFEPVEFKGLIIIIIRRRRINHYVLFNEYNTYEFIGFML